MEELEFDVEIQGWHPDIPINYDLMHAYLRHKGKTTVAYMLTLKLYSGNDFEISNTYISGKYKGIEGQLQTNVLRRMGFN